MRTSINLIITLTSDKLARWGQGSPQEIRSTRDDSSHKVMFPRLPAIIRRPMQGQHSPSMSPHTGGSVGTKLSRSRWQHNRKAFWAPVAEGPRYKDDRRTASPGTRRLYFSMGADMSCNQTRVIRKLYHSQGTQDHL
jgi:hypothetical protein